jgi:hypothetical protein
LHSKEDGTKLKGKQITKKEGKRKNIQQWDKEVVLFFKKCMGLVGCHLPIMGCMPRGVNGVCIWGGF